MCSNCWQSWSKHSSLSSTSCLRASGQPLSRSQDLFCSFAQRSFFKNAFQIEGRILWSVQIFGLHGHTAGHFETLPAFFVSQSGTHSFYSEPELLAIWIHSPKWFPASYHRVELHTLNAWCQIFGIPKISWLHHKETCLSQELCDVLFFRCKFFLMKKLTASFGSLSWVRAFQHYFWRIKLTVSSFQTHSCVSEFIILFFQY